MVAMVTDLVILMKSLRESENPKIITLLCTYVLLILAIIIPPLDLMTGKVCTGQ